MLTQREFSEFEPNSKLVICTLSGLRQTLALYLGIVFCTLFISSVLTSTRSGGQMFNSGNSWFENMKGSCDAMRVESAIAQNPPTNDSTGIGFAATCYGLAGKIDKARDMINRLSTSGERFQAASIVFGVAHPIADRGDDASSGPMMELVIEYQPGNYMALYHAGMSEYILGDHASSLKNLKGFLEIYKAQDGWTQRGQTVVEALESGKPLPIDMVKGFTLE